MSTTAELVLRAVGTGVALAGAPGAVQAVIVTETARGGIARGARAVLGASVTFAALLAGVAVGIARIAPSATTLGALTVAGGVVLAWLAVDGFRAAGHDAILTQRDASGASRHPRAGDHEPSPASRDPSAPSRTPNAASRAPSTAAGAPAPWAGPPPVVRGALAVGLNPGAWLFLGAVAAPMLGLGAELAGAPAQVLVLAGFVVGAALGDSAIVVAGGLGLPRASDVVRVRILRGLNVALGCFGVWLVWSGVVALTRTSR